MDTAVPKLDTLPAEIIQRIASTGSCEDVLALVKVNHALRRNCNERHIFRSIIRNRSGRGRSEWQEIPLTSADSTSAWARYALADSQAAIPKLYHSAVSLAKWGPQLMTSNHPVLREHKHINMLYHIANNHAVPDVNHKAILMLCLALTIMSRSPPDDVAQPGLLPAGPVPDRNFHPPRQELRQKLIRGLSRELLSYSEDEYWWCPERNTAAFLKLYCKALSTLSIMSVRIREELAKGTIREMNHLGIHSESAPPVQISVPTTESIRFRSFMDMPLPFAADIATALPFCHLASMTSKSFIEEGEWAGFYSMSIGPLHPRPFDPPMRGIRFQVCDDPELPARTLDAKGEDGVGSFRLFGKIALNTGEITLEKQYDGQGPHWDWFCLMTPFGIAGTWGSDDWGGWVWLWKA